MPITFKQESPSLVVASGDVTDDSDLTPVIAGMKGAVSFDLGGVARMNSVGVRQWVRFVHAIPADLKITLLRCPVFFMKQVTMIGNFLGPTKVGSTYLPYVCTKCDASRNELLEAGALPKAGPPSVGACAECGGAMEFDDAEDVYHAFLKELGRA